MHIEPRLITDKLQASSTSRQLQPTRKTVSLDEHGCFRGSLAEAAALSGELAMEMKASPVTALEFDDERARPLEAVLKRFEERVDLSAEERVTRLRLLAQLENIRDDHSLLRIGIEIMVGNDLFRSTGGILEAMDAGACLIGFVNHIRHPSIGVGFERNLFHVFHRELGLAGRFALDRATACNMAERIIGVPDPSLLCGPGCCLLWDVPPDIRIERAIPGALWAIIAEKRRTKLAQLNPSAYNLACWEVGLA